MGKIKYYLIKDNGMRSFAHPINEKHIIIDGTWWEEHDEIVKLTEEEIQHILQMGLCAGNIMEHRIYKNGSLNPEIKFTNTQNIKNKIRKILDNEK